MYPNRNPYKYCKLLNLGCRVDSKSWRLPVVSKDKAVPVLFADPLKRSIRRWNVELHRKRVENIGLEKLKRSMSHVTNTESGGCECCVLTTDIAWRDCARYPFIKCIGDRVMIVTADSRVAVLESFFNRYFHTNPVKYNKKLECNRLVLSLCFPCGDGNNVKLLVCVRGWPLLWGGENGFHAIPENCCSEAYLANTSYSSTICSTVATECSPNGHCGRAPFRRYHHCLNSTIPIPDFSHDSLPYGVNK